MRFSGRFCALLCCVVTVAVDREAPAQIYTWVGSGASPPNGIYSNPASWTPNNGLVPGGGDVAFFNANAMYTVTFTGNQALGVASMLSGNVSWLSDSATVRQFTVDKLDAGGANQSLTIGSATNPVLVTTSNPLELGTINSGGNGTIVVSGANSTLNGPGAILGSYAASDGTLRYQNDAQGSITGVLEIGSSVSDGCDGVLEVLSGADLLANSLNLATTTSTAVGAVNVSGAGSTLLQSGASTLTVGSATGGAGTINVNSGGTFTSGSGLVTVNATGTINVSGGTMNLLNDFTNSQGTFNLSAAGVINGYGVNGANGTPPSAGAPGKSITSTGMIAMSGTAQINLSGGAGGSAIQIGDGANGGNGGILNISAGSASLIDSASINLRGGSGGNGGNLFSAGGTSGLGGTLNLANATLSLANSTAIDLFGSTGGTINITGGTLSLNDSSTINQSGFTGGTLNLHSGSASLSGSANLNFAGGGTLHIVAGSFTASGTAAVNLTGANGSNGSSVPVRGPGSGSAGGTLDISGGTTTIQHDSIVNLTGGNGGNGASTTGQNGGNGGNGGIVQLSNGVLNMTGGRILLAGGGGGGVGFLGGGSPGSPGAAGSFNLTGGTFNMSGGEVTTGTFQHPGTGTFNFTGGVLHATTFNGNLVNAGGTLAPGASPATLTVNGNYLQSAGTLEIELGGTAANQFDKLTVTNKLGLSGTLDVTIINGFVPQAGNSFDILDSGTLGGTFATLNLPGGGLSWNTSQLYTTGTLTVGGVVGDYNKNGTVDAADYVVWRDTLGQSGTGLVADGNFNNVIDSGDYDTWRAHFGQTAGSGVGSSANAAVPEPTSALILLMGLLTMCLRRRIAGARIR